MSSTRSMKARSAAALLRVFVVVVGLVAGVLVAVAGASPASAAVSGPVFGVQFHGTWGDYTDVQRAQVLDALKANGASTVRIDVSWRMLEPDKSGTFSAWGLGVVDNAVKMASDRGLKPLVTLWMAPQWANGSTDERVAPTSAAGLAGLTSVSQRLAARYNGVVDGWEVWNEPNSNDFMRGADPVVYAKVLQAAYDGFKAGSSGTPVVFGGPMFVDDVWVGKVLAAGGAGHYDVMGVHPYQGVADEAPELADNGTMWRMNHLPALIAVMSKYGEGAKPIWFTEFGWQAHVTLATDANWQRGVSPATQADFLARTVAMVKANYPTVARLYWYKDRADSANPAEAGYGLVYPDGTTTPALKAAAPTTKTTTPPAPAAPSAVPAGGVLKISTGQPDTTVLGNLTVVAPVGAGYTTAWPCDEARPTASTNNYAAGQTIPNFVAVHTDPNGDFCVFSSAQTHLLFDEVAETTVIQASAPTRKVDTRDAGAALPAGGVVKVHTGAANSLVLGNLTVTAPAAAGYTTAWPCSEARPNTSVNNYTAGQTIPNFAAVRTDAAGDFCVYTMASAHVLFDQVAATTSLNGHNAVRVGDSRLSGTPVPGGQVWKLNTGAAGQLLLGNLTVADPAGAGYTTLYPCDQPRPTASTNNYTAGQTIPNFAAVQSDAAGQVCVFTTAATGLVWDQVVETSAITAHAPVRKVDTRTDVRAA